MKLHLWRFTIRRLGLTKSECKPFFEYAVMECQTEKEAVNQIKNNKFTIKWWEEVIIIDLEMLGEIWYWERVKNDTSRV